MLLDDRKNKLTEIIAAQIISVIYPLVIARTDKGQYLPVNLSKKERHDPLLWRSLESVRRAKLWVPLTFQHHLCKDGWLLNN
ncbi:hypothetical protein JCM15457_1894 [Liquorilactobacillus sucicola DSM 21376 = JCM 15457]|uniref:hypothetical protein n=1 Tax=Liquorilactobacillus sucicola TaxID=519050 RepID=UPI000435267D|nr:hypothetical protein [Liquorilactobacillus sucicola]GAJ26940.1 hypothetical protein JCM15457_1894 [Liquorilactobacillus sucicola DSM 21376 = JCM 15457]